MKDRTQNPRYIDALAKMEAEAAARGETVSYDDRYALACRTPGGSLSGDALTSLESAARYYTFGVALALKRDARTKALSAMKRHILSELAKGPLEAHAADEVGYGAVHKAVITVWQEPMFWGNHVSPYRQVLHDYTLAVGRLWWHLRHLTDNPEQRQGYISKCDECVRNLIEMEP